MFLISWGGYNRGPWLQPGYLCSYLLWSSEEAVLQQLQSDQGKLPRFRQEAAQLCSNGAPLQLKQAGMLIFVHFKNVIVEDRFFLPVRPHQVYTQKRWRSFIQHQELMKRKSE